MAQKWVTSWAAADQGPYPVGNPVAQPDLRFALPPPDAVARDQSFRLIVKPSIWGSRIRLRFSNAFGTKPVTFDGVFTGLQASGATLLPSSNRPVTFAGKKTVTVPPGGQAWSDAVTLPWVSNPGAPELLGRKLAVSFHLAGSSGSITWHAAAMQTSYLTMAGAGALGELEDESAFPNSTTSWFFLDALDVQTTPDTGAVVALGDSITDGVNSTLNGDDRWPDVLSRRLQAAGVHMGVIDAGIGGNRVAGPGEYSAGKPFAGGPGAGSRIERDVTSLSGVTHVIWLEGINDIGPEANASVDAVKDAMRAAVKRLRDKLPKAKVIGATLTSAGGATLNGFASPAVEQKRHALNEFIRNNGGLFDGVVDFDQATTDPGTGGLRAEFVPDSTVGGPGDGLHPNRAGYQAMGGAIDLRLLRLPTPGAAPPPPRRPRPTAAAGQAGAPPD